MIVPGDSLENPATGTRLVWRRTSSETGGRAVVVEVFLPPNGFVPALHVHPRQRQRVEVLGGSVGVQVARRRAVVGAGTRLTVPAGTPHRFWNAGEETAQVMTEITPALRFESLLETLFALAADGRTNAAGRPGPLQLAVTAAAHFDTVRLAFPPAPLQRLALALAAPLGRAHGYRAVHAPAPGRSRAGP